LILSYSKPCYLLLYIVGLILVCFLFSFSLAYDQAQTICRANNIRCDNQKKKTKKKTGAKLYSAKTKKETINVVTPIRIHKHTNSVRSTRPNEKNKRERERTIIMYIKKIYIDYPLLAGVTYLAVDDLSIDNDEVSIIESSYCSPSSLCFSRFSSSS
jgi:hypothetical protein